MKHLTKRSSFHLLVVTFAVGLGISCGPPASNTNVSIAPANSVVNSSANANSQTNANANINTVASSAIETTEPNTYQATVSLHIETKGDNKTQTPKLQANVARDGADRRMELTMPNGEKIIYLTIGDRQFMIAPARKQYAELNKDTLGVDVRKLLTPDQIVDQVKNFKGVQRSGEEKYEGRDVVKYTFNAIANTQTKAGEIETDSYVLVDKETNLPILSVTDMASASGQVQGVSGLKVITDISNIKTEVDKTLFEEPKDLNKVDAEVVKGQAKAFFDMAQLVLGQLLRAGQPASN